jgi:D-alanyl-D-alanine dipeptidase
VDERLVELDPDRHGVTIGLAYAGPANLAGTPVYGNLRCLLHRDAVAGLVRAADWAVQCGTRLKVLDAYRPPWAQERLWRALPDPRFVASVEVGSCHTRGVALDVTLEDGQGVDLDMGVPFDDMVDEARHFHPALPPAVQRNRALLLAIMTQAGFQASDTEWWHYQLPDARAYPLLQDDRMVPSAASGRPAPHPGAG